MDQSSILSEEIKSWKRFEYALKEEDRLVFSKMLSECRENEDYIKAACSKDEYFSAESLFMVLILQQQKMITELVDKLKSGNQTSGGGSTSGKMTGAGPVTGGATSGSSK
jgi:uncharacterized protein (UPF0303 family)